MTSNGQKAEDVWISENILQLSYMVNTYDIYKQSNIVKSYAFSALV